MTTVLIGIVLCVVLCGVAVVANSRFRAEDRLPMQWVLPNEVGWSAPRFIALAFIPGLAIMSFAGLFVVSLYMQPRPGQEDMAVPALITIGLGFLAVQLLHLWMIARTIR